MRLYEDGHVSLQSVPKPIHFTEVLGRYLPPSLRHTPSKAHVRAGDRGEQHAPPPVACVRSSDEGHSVPSTHWHWASHANGLLHLLALAHDLADDIQGLIVRGTNARLRDNLLGIPERGGEVAILEGGLCCGEQRGTHLLGVAQRLVATSRCLGHHIGLAEVALAGDQSISDRLRGTCLALRAAQLLEQGQRGSGSSHHLLLATRCGRGRAQQCPGKKVQAGCLALLAKLLQFLGHRHCLYEFCSLHERAGRGLERLCLLLGHALRLVE
mmetsp:Transcript_58220/g.170250  ORF Transcript_58220/g.170250 Transcript_58220/m.170250 type:complete len:269 (-) Transcript_58220:953-1759(-)